MKHGMTTQFHTKIKIKSILNQQKDAKLNVEEPHFIVSPDLELDWVCHGKCLVKIKCPASVIDSKPDINNYKHLEYKNGVVRLMKTSE